MALRALPSFVFCLLASCAAPQPTSAPTATSERIEETPTDDEERPSNVAPPAAVDPPPADRPSAPTDEETTLTLRVQEDLPLEWGRCTVPEECVALGGCCSCSTYGTIALNRRFLARVRIEPECSHARCRRPSHRCATAVGTCPLGGGQCTYTLAP